MFKSKGKVVSKIWVKVEKTINFLIDYSIVLRIKVFGNEIALGTL